MNENGSKFHTVLLMTCPKAAFSETMGELDEAKESLAEIGVKLVVVRYNNTASTTPRMESYTNDLARELAIIRAQKESANA